MYKQEIAKVQESEMKFRFQYDQAKVHWQLEKQSLEERISTLKKDLEESKAALIENLASSTNEEKSDKKKMEMWFKRRLDAIEHHIIDLKTTPNDDSKFDKLLTKVRRLKHKQPWNGPRKPNLMLDDVALNQKSEIYSNGTSTPYSHYVCVLSSAASENNPLDKGFLCSINNSVPTTRKSQHSFLSGPLSKSINTSKQAILESVVKKLHDSKLSFTAKEKLFCDIFKQSPCANDAFQHVKLEDILNAANISKSVDSLSLDHSKCGKPTFKFNQKIRFDDLKDTKLEKVISTIPSQGSQKSSDLFGNSLRRSKSFNGQRAALFFGSPDANLEHLMNLDMSSHQKESGLDQGIIQEISEQLAGGQDSRNLLASLQRLLSPTNGAFLKNLSQKLNFHEEFGSCGKQDDLDLSLIEEKKEDVNHNGGGNQFFDKLISDSFLVDGNDDDIIKDFLSNHKTKTNENFNILDSDQKITFQEPQISNSKAVGRNLLNNFLEDEEEEPVVTVVEKPAKQNLCIDIEKIEEVHRRGKDNKSPEEIQQEVLNKVKKTTEVPSLNFNRVKESFQKHISKAMPPVIIIDTPVNQSNFQDKKSFKTYVEEETDQTNKAPLSIETPTSGAGESPMTTPAGLFKANFKMKFGNIDKDYQSQQLYNCPSRSIDEQQLTGIPKPPMGSRKRTHQRPNLSLIEDNIKQNIYGKPSTKPDGDISLDVEYQFQYQEQEGEQDNFHSNNQAKKSIITDLSSHNQKAADYKNGRNSWSFSIEQEQKFAHPPKVVELHNLNSLIGRNTHTRKTSDACPPRKAENQAYFVRSSYAQNMPQISQSNTPHPFSYEENNLLSNKSVLEPENMNILKKVIPREKPKQNIAPSKVSFEQYKASVKLLGNENIAPENNNNQPKKPNPTNKGGDIYQAYRERIKDLRPISPLDRDTSMEFRLALPLQKKAKEENREKVVTNISNSNSSINGSAQFRARMFAHKKV